MSKGSLLSLRVTCLFTTLLFSQAAEHHGNEQQCSTKPVDQQFKLQFTFLVELTAREEWITNDPKRPEQEQDKGHDEETEIVRAELDESVHWSVVT